MTSEIIIKFETKFTQKDLENCINNFWTKSFEAKNIIFDLSHTQWISSEEVTFLFSWIVKLKAKEKKLKIILPYSFQYEKEDIDNKDRRKFLKYYLLRVWGMFDKLGLSDLDFENIDDYNRSITKNEKFNYGKKIIPFQRIPVTYTDYATEKVDEKFNLIKSPKNGVFFLESDIIKFLNLNECYSPFENKVISDILTKELVINSMEHTNEDESFFTTALNDKWPISGSQYFIDHYKKERDVDSLDFYKDKKLIQIKLDSELSRLNQQQKNKLKDVYHPSLAKYDDFLNQSFLEFTYIDYGGGIHSTLGEQFEKFKSKNNFEKVSVGFKSKNDHSQILEYAFLTESSKEPFDDAETRYNELIPRGLYFIVDMVRRYKGLLIARSGRGKVIYDFSNRIKIKKTNDNTYTTILERIYIAKDAIIDVDFTDAFFPGTMISIILPERKSIDFKKSAVRIDSEILNKIVFNRDDPEYYPAQIYAPESYEFLNLAFEHQKGEDEISIKAFNSRTGITKLIFRSISDKLKELSEKNCVLFIDFEFIPISGHNDILKIMHYLTNNPMVNERTKVIVLNIGKLDIEKLKSYEIENFGEFEMNSSNFLFKPIPILNVNKTKNQKAVISDIQWIGVHNPEDLQILTNLFFGTIEFNKGISIEAIKNDWLLEGNVITKHNQRAYSIFTDFQDLMDKAKETKKRQLEEWLINKIIDGENPAKKEDKFYFLTSKGSYQRKYLSLYETLNYKYTARYFAKYLLDKYLDFYRDRYPESYYIEGKFDKIINVTVSSQLIGVEIRNLIKDNDAYIFLRNTDYIKNRSGNKARIVDCPKLIKLASYFSFDSEKPFEEIKEGDKVLIVNDVISTGSLLKRLKEGVEDRNAIVSGVVTVADSRKRNVNESIEYKSHYFENFESKIISILAYEDNNKFNLVKLRKKPIDVKDVKRINPILNAVVSLESEHTEKIKLLYENPEELIKTKPFQNDIFRIGHFKQNITHNSYFTNMHNLFYDENGKQLLEELKSRIINQYLKINLNKNDYLYSYLNDLKMKSDREGNQEYSCALKLIIENSKNVNYLEPEYKPKFIFYPVYSGIEEVSEDVLYEVFGTDKANIISLQRYETKNGWRFPFPAKRYNKPTKGAHILIIDSGALSGHSLVQLIDSISFLDVGRIDFLSIVGRIDDFQREFYSRLRAIKVKSFRGENEGLMNSIINLNIMFGINLHIPPSISTESCPYCSEIAKLEGYLEENEKSEKLPEQTVIYIKDRIYQEIPLIEDSGVFKYPKYIPTLKSNNEPDFIQIFNIRDKLGKVDSYRFYVEYFEYFDDIGNQIDTNNITILFHEDKKDLLMKIELILICVIHEPHLVNLLKDLLASIYEISLSLVNQIILNKNLIDSLNYNWSQYAIVRLSYNLISQNKIALNEFYYYKTFERIFDFSTECDECLNYLSYLLSGSFYKLKGDEFCSKDTIKCILSFLKPKYSKTTKGGRVLDNLIRKIEAHEVNSIKEALHNLNNYFITEEAKEGHTEIELAFNEITTLLVNIDNQEHSENYVEVLYDNVKYIVFELERRVYKNLKYLKNRERIEEWFGKIYEDIFGNGHIYFVLDSLIKQFKEIEQNPNSIEKLIEIARNFDNFYTMHLYRDLHVNPFYKFCLSQGFELQTVLTSIVNSFNIKNVIISYDLVLRDELIPVHKIFFEKAIKEILKNAEQKAEREFKQINLLISTTILNKGIIELKFTQDCNFDETGIKGGFNNLVKPVLSEFGIPDSFEIIELSPKFIFKVNFNI